MINQIPMTIEGAEKLRKELQKLKNVIRPRIIFSIKEARNHGDLKENAEYHAAREEQAFCEGRIQHIESVLSKSNIIDITKIFNSGKVIFGVTVKIINIETKKKFIYRIVGDHESDFKNNLISINSPMARGLIGKKINDIAIVETPNKEIEFKILSIKHI
ncbi:transcription elongation factor GreA [Buchnera aphidicola (Kurisakia onigurumii)]|uniref:transcription elongation factor GreA n=1 Tax=Buchnera aphidicola TaxID=9 RepID=UPI0031B705BA